MNFKQRIALGATLAIVALLLLFPPWVGRVHIPPSCDATTSLGYAFIFAGPSAAGIENDEEKQRAACPVTAAPELVDAKVAINYRQWLLPIVIIIGIGLTLTWVFADSTTLPESMQSPDDREIRCLKCGGVVAPGEAICPVCQHQVRTG